MANQTSKLNIGDKIGFTYLAQDIDANDKILFFPVVGIGERDGETAYYFQFPDGEVSRAGVRHSDLGAYVIERLAPEAASVADRMICLSDRRAEFAEALTRAGKSDLEVFPDWERDAFVIVNNDKGNEYKVNFETRADGKLYGDCECSDFSFRKRICKHIGEVLAESLFSAAVRN